jgi:hypothetical protein
VIDIPSPVQDHDLELRIPALELIAGVDTRLAAADNRYIVVFVHR